MASPDHGFLSNARNFIINNPIFLDVPGTTRSMKKLYRCIISGAGFDSSVRDPPPRCLPGTRIQLYEKINTWFHNKEREKALLWLNGPAGVGKSAVVQTFAESLAKTGYLGASLFFPPHYSQKNYQRAFTTIAYQLATRISEYKDYITKQINLDPSLLQAEMGEQFRAFIIEPFGNGEIGSRNGSWGILLDGLDECGGVDQQCQIVRLISKFVLDFPLSPLVWIIASRTELRIAATFKDEAIVPSHWSEYILMNSDEAMRDVELYLRYGFGVIRKHYPDLAPLSWPSEMQISKLCMYVSGLFIFASSALDFADDPDNVNRLDLLLSRIDHRDAGGTDNDYRPFAFFDVMYAEILASVPPTSWCITRLVLGIFLFGFNTDELPYPLECHSLMGVSIIFDIDLSAVYAALSHLCSVIQVPEPQHAHTSKNALFHVSFRDYLMDPKRSHRVWIDRSEFLDELIPRLYKIYLGKPWYSGWAGYPSQLSGKERSDFYNQLKHDAASSLCNFVSGSTRTKRGGGPFKSQKDRSDCLDALCAINTAELCQFGKSGVEITDFLFGLWKAFPGELMDRGLCKQLQLRDLRLDHLDHKINKPVSIAYSRGTSMERLSPTSLDALQDFIVKLLSLQEDRPDLLVLVYGSTPKKRNAFLHAEMKYDRGNEGTFYEEQYYSIPYPY